MQHKTPKQATMDDVAAAANVSKPTVSRALRGHPSVTEQTRKKVMEAAHRLGYAINRNAQKLREKHTNTVAVILDLNSHPNRRISDPFILELLAGVSEALSIRKQDLLLSPSGLETAENYLDLVRSRVVDGFIFLGPGSKEDLLLDLSKLEVPFVVWGGVSTSNAYCTVGSDNLLGGLLIGQRFVSLKRKNLVFMGDPTHTEIRMRRDGLLQALKGANYEFTFNEIKVHGFSFSASFEAFSDYLKDKPAPDGIFAYSDTAAIAALTALNEQGLQPQADYSLAGYNDIVQASHFSPSLTTVKQDTFIAGGLLVEKFISIVSGHTPTSSTIPTELIVRQT